MNCESCGVPIQKPEGYGTFIITFVLIATSTAASAPCSRQWIARKGLDN